MPRKSKKAKDVAQETFQKTIGKKNSKDKEKKLYKNLEKARVKLAREYEKITDKKQYYLHHVANQLLNENQVVSVETLNVKGMMKNHNLAKAIQNLSIGEFNRILAYKADWYGKTTVKVGRFFPSSKLCHECGYINRELKLSDREWTCPVCKTVHDRDVTAGINLDKEGLRILRQELVGRSTPELRSADRPTMDDPNPKRKKLKSSGGTNQKDKSATIVGVNA